MINDKRKLESNEIFKELIKNLSIHLCISDINNNKNGGKSFSQVLFFQVLQLVILLYVILS